MAPGGCGGVVFTQYERLYRLIRAHADRGKKFWHPDFIEGKDPTLCLFPALNLNLDEISCAIGIKTLEKLDDTIRRRLDFLHQLHDAILQKLDVCRPSPVSERDSPFFYPISVDTSSIMCTKEEFANAILNEGIALNPHYKQLVNEWNYVKSYLGDSFECTNAILWRNNSFNLLLNENYGTQELIDIIRAIKKVEKFYRV